MDLSPDVQEFVVLVARELGLARAAKAKAEPNRPALRRYVGMRPRLADVQAGHWHDDDHRASTDCDSTGAGRQR